MIELSGELSNVWHSAFSLMPDRELALVFAEDSAEASGGLVLAVSSDSRLLRYMSWLRTRSLGLMGFGSYRSGVAVELEERFEFKPA